MWSLRQMKGTLFIIVQIVLILTSRAFTTQSRPSSQASSISPPLSSRTRSWSVTKENPNESFSALTDGSRVAVAGATGRTGSLVVQELLNRGVNVVALVRNVQKAESIFSSVRGMDSLKIVQCDLGSERDVIAKVKGCDSAIWCATGFSSSPGINFLEKIQLILGATFAPRQSIDIVGIAALAKALQTSDETMGPKIVMLSSAGVTRPKWDNVKKARFPGSADIPIVRLNPFGILDIKAESEEKLRQSGTSYCIFRPCGLNDNWPENSRPIFSQGDIAVGRIHRKDVAKILVDCLVTKEASGKTFEAFSLSGYSPAISLATSLSRLRKDSDGIPSMEVLETTYSAMQQLLPGEKQDSAALAMGQTYEQLDKGEVGRLGKRGEENAESAAPKPSS